MYMPSIFQGNLVDDVFDSMFTLPFQYKNATQQMSTNITDCKDFYQMTIELPGYGKEDVKAELADGYLTITAEKNENNESKELNYVRRERYTGKCSRSYFVGNHITKEDIQAKFENGILSLTIPKKKEVEKNEDNYVLIE